MDSKEALAAKIKYFRERAGMNQLDLEVAVNASTGSISRMENNKVNPTKETLSAIAKALKLNKTQQTLLLNIAIDSVTEEEKAEVIQSISAFYSNPEIIGFLIDDHWNVVKLSVGFIQLLALTPTEITSMIGENIMVLIFDPNSPLNKRLDKKTFPLFAEYVVSRKLADIQNIRTELWVRELIARLLRIQSFQVAWDKVKISPREYFSNKSRTMYFNLNNRLVPMLYGREVLKDNPRFIVIDYTPLT